VCPRLESLEALVNPLATLVPGFGLPSPKSTGSAFSEFLPFSQATLDEFHFPSLAAKPRRTGSTWMYSIMAGPLKLQRSESPGRPLNDPALVQDLIEFSQARQWPLARMMDTG